MRLYHRPHKDEPVPALYRSPTALDSLPTLGGTGRGIDLYAIDRVLSGEHPGARLTEPEARTAWALLLNESDLWASEIGGLLSVTPRSVQRWRKTQPPIPAPEGGDMNPTHWQHGARCDTESAELFFPLGYTRTYEPQIEEARAICTSCPVMATCREDALSAEGGSAVEYRHGIRGALTPPERHALHRSRVRKAREIAALAEMRTAA